MTMTDVNEKEEKENETTTRLENAFGSASEQPDSQRMQLTNEQRSWLQAIERDYPDLPVGFALAAVQLYAENPSLLSKENIDRWSKTKPLPRENVTQGSIRVMSPEEAAEFEKKISEYEAKGQGEVIKTDGDEI